MAQGTIYTEDQKNKIMTDICNSVIENKISFNQAVKDSPINLVTFYKWLVANDELKSLYNYAREIRSDVLFEEIIEIADTTEEGIEMVEKPSGTEIKTGDMTNHRRLKIDARKWVVSKMNPKKYGDKIDVNHSGQIDSKQLSDKEYQERLDKARKVIGL